MVKMKWLTERTKGTLYFKKRKVRSWHFFRCLYGKQHTVLICIKDALFY